MAEYLIILGVVLFLYARTMRAGLVLDDVYQYKWFQKRHGTPHLKLWNLIYGAGLFENIALDHAFTLFINILIACLITLNFGLTAALVFMTLPANNQVLVWLNGRRYQFSLLFCLLAYSVPLTGFLWWPVALYCHPIAAPMIIITAALKWRYGLFWAIGGVLAVPHLKQWLANRWGLAEDIERRAFEPGKLVMAVKNLADYWVSFLWHPVFSMYHPRTWGLVEYPQVKKQVYAVDKRFWGSVAVIICAHAPAIWFPGWLVYAVLADLAVFQWLGFWKNPVQYWAPRYAVLFYLMVSAGVAVIVPAPVLWAFALFNMGQVFNNLNMYKNLNIYLLSHAVNQPDNLHANWQVIHIFSHYAELHRKAGKITHALQFDVFSAAVGFLWCSNHPTPDMVHEYMTKLLDKKS